MNLEHLERMKGVFDESGNCIHVSASEQVNILIEQLFDWMKSQR